MPDDAPFTPPRKKPNVLWWIGGVFLLFVGLFFFQLFASSRPVIVSKQTTFITEPLRPDGLPDYEEYWLEQLREGVTPESNAAVLIWPALPRGDVSPADFLAVCDEIGFERVPLASEALQAIDNQATRAAVKNWLVERGGVNDEIDTVVDGIAQAAMYRPWKSDELPPLADWIRANKRPLDAFVEGSRRQRCYMPSPTLLDANHDQLIAVLLPGVQGMRDVARGLSCRAMWNLGEGRLEESWQDLSAIYRLARLTSQGPTIVEQLVAIALNGIACDDTVLLLADERLSPQLARKIAGELAPLASPSNMTDSLDQFERLSGLDAVIYAKLYGFETLSSDGPVGSDPESNVGQYKLDWNLILRYLNGWYDQLAAAARMPTRAARRDAFTKFDADLEATGKQVASPLRALVGFVSCKRRSEFIAVIITNTMIPALSSAMLAEDRANSQLELTRLAAALANYRIEHKSYPESLDALVPANLPKIPVDLYNAKPYVYRRDGDGYLLYSLGENGVEDEGSNIHMHVLNGRPIDDFPFDQRPTMAQEIPLGADDISIHVPRPAFELPQAPTAE